MIPALLCFQVVPLVLFPFETYSINTQEWWLPVLLAVLAIVSLVQILGRHSIAPWPWYLMAFAQGFNIISRLMMLLPHSTVGVEGGGLAFNAPYVIVAFATMLLSAFEIWYCELPEVRQRYAPHSSAKAAA